MISYMGTILTYFPLPLSHLQLFLYLQILLKFMASSMDLSPFDVPCVYLCLELTNWNWITYHGLIPRENSFPLWAVIDKEVPEFYFL